MDHPFHEPEAVSRRPEVVPRSHRRTFPGRRHGLHRGRRGASSGQAQALALLDAGDCPGHWIAWKSLPARLTALRHHLRRLNAVRIGTETKSLANHKSNVRAAINALGPLQRLIPTRGAPLSPEWYALMKAIPEVKASRLLRGRSRAIAAQRRKKPSAMSEKLVGRLLCISSCGSLYETGVARQRELMRAWNRCVDATSRLASFQSYVASAESTNKRRQDGHIFRAASDMIWISISRGWQRHTGASSGKRRQPSKSPGYETRQRGLVAFANKAVASGIAMESLISLPALLAPSVVQTVLEAYLGDDKPSRYVIDLPWKLLAVARSIDADPATIEHLEDMREALEDNAAAQ